MTYNLKAATVFEDFDIAAKRSVFKTFPAGTAVKDILRISNPNPIRLVSPVGVAGWIASVPMAKLAV